MMKNTVKKILLILLLFSFLQGFAQNPYNTGLTFDDEAYTNTPVKKAELKRSYDNLPTKSDLKPYCPTPQKQEDKSTCVGWAIGYAACTITEGVSKNIIDKTQLDDMATSPDFVYTFGKKTVDKDCTKGVVMDETLVKLYGTTIPRKKNFKMVCTANTLPSPSESGVKILQHSRIFKKEDTWNLKLAQLKKALSNKKPVVIGIECSKSFFDLKDVWDGNTTDFRGGHALCIIGYDDSFQGGAIEIMNSWGKDWGKEGFGWIKYTDLQSILKYAYEINTDFSSKEQNPSKQTEKNTELNAKIILKLSTGADMPIALNNSIDSRGLKPVKENSKPSNASPTSSPAKPILEAQYKTLQPYKSGTRYRIYLDISQPIYLYVLGSDLTGQVAALFPPDQTISSHLSNKNMAIALPDEQWFIEMDDTKGKDFMLFLYSSTPLSISTFISTMNKENGNFFEKIKKTVGTKLQFIDTKDLQNSNIQFQTQLRTDIIQALCLEIEHQ
jgi:Papain family cysteine protease/Domain of unknown function (DUF4384)